MKRSRAIQLFIVYSLLVVGLCGCTTVKEYSQTRRRLSTISSGNLKGLSKVDVIKRMGHPLAISKSEVSECWYYAEPKPIWIWFKEDKVEYCELE